MKRSLLVILVFALVSCNSTQLVESWKNPEITIYAPSKILVVGLTSNIEARQKFETKLKEELELRGAEAVSSLDIFKTEKMTEIELKELENDLINKGFDTVLFSKVIGVEDKIVYKNNYDGYEATYRKFSEDYLKYQDVFYNPGIIGNSQFIMQKQVCIVFAPTKDRELIWKGYIDIVDPESTDKTIINYVNLVIAILEEEQLVNLKLLADEDPKEELIN